MDVRVCVLLAITPVLAHAQPAPDASSKPDPTATEKQPPQPDSRPAGPRAPESTPLHPKFEWEPFGYLRLQYKAVQNDPNVEFVGRDDGFELQNARIGVRGRLERRAAFVIAFDGAVDERAQINVPEGKLRVGLRDAYGDLFFGTTLDHGDLKSAMFTRAGFFQSWVDPEGQVPDTAREFVDRPIESRGIRATEGFQTPGLTPGRSLGAAFRFEPMSGFSAPAGGIEIAVQNGADEFASNNDNDKPAVSIAGLSRFGKTGYVVAAGRYNPRTVGDLPFRQDETDVQGTAGFRIPVGPVAISGGIVFVHTTFATTGGPAQDAYGGHGQVTFTAGNEDMPFTVGYRFGILDPSSFFTTDRVMEHTAAAVLGVPRYRMRVQFQLTHVIEQAARSLSNSRAQLAAEIAL